MREKYRKTQSCLALAYVGVGDKTWELGASSMRVLLHNHYDISPASFFVLLKAFKKKPINIVALFITVIILKSKIMGRNSKVNSIQFAIDGEFLKQ